MTRFEDRLRGYAEGLVALTIAIVVGLLSIAHVVPADGSVVNAAILIILALLAVTMLRDRASAADALKDVAAVRPVDGAALGQALAEARWNTGFWRHKGGTGDQLRAVTLPKRLRQARQGAFAVWLEIIDPTNLAMCEEYARLRNSSDSSAGPKHEWTAERARREAYATILAVCSYQKQFASLTLDIALSRVLSTFHWDLSATHAIQSQENPSASALVFDQSRPYYKAFERELSASFKQARPVPMEQAKRCPLSNPPTPKEVRELFTALELYLPRDAPDAEVAAIIRAAFPESDRGGRPGGGQLLGVYRRRISRPRRLNVLKAYAGGLVVLGITVLFALLTVLDVLGANGGVINAAILVTLALLALTLLRDRAAVRDAVKKVNEVRLVSGPEIGQALAQARSGTSVWKYKGGTGGYLRTNTLPQCVLQAQQKGGSLNVRLEIIDPTNLAVCERYAHLRGSLVASAGFRTEEWTTDRVRVEAYATILAACWHQQRFSLLELGIGLSQATSTFRWDLSATHAIQSQEDPSASSLVFDNDHDYYDALERELVTSFERASPVRLERAKQCRLSNEPTLDEVRTLFRELKLELPSSFPDSNVRAIIRKALGEKNAFG